MGFNTKMVVYDLDGFGGPTWLRKPLNHNSSPINPDLTSPFRRFLPLGSWGTSETTSASNASNVFVSWGAPEGWSAMVAFPCGTAIPSCSCLYNIYSLFPIQGRTWSSGTQPTRPISGTMQNDWSGRCVHLWFGKQWSMVSEGVKQDLFGVWCKNWSIVFHLWMGLLLT